MEIAPPSHTYAIPRKIDLDVLLCLALFSFQELDKLIQAPPAYEQRKPLLLDPTIACIEIGNSGDIQNLNFDHHYYDGEDNPLPIPEVSASYQVWEYIKSPSNWFPFVDYVNRLDCRGPDALGTPPEPPTLSFLLSGLLLLAKDQQWHFKKAVNKGVSMLQYLQSQGIDPFGSIPGYDIYFERKQKEQDKINDILPKAKWYRTDSGKWLGVLETSVYGAPSALYQLGADYVLVRNTEWMPSPGSSPVVKYTLAGNCGNSVRPVYSDINKIESGWGGPESGTILGSPVNGSEIDLNTLITISLHNL